MDILGERRGIHFKYKKLVIKHEGAYNRSSESYSFQQLNTVSSG